MDEQKLSQTIINVINTIFSNLFNSIDNTLYDNLDRITFINSSILNNSKFQSLLGSGSISGLIYICDALLIAFLLFYILRYYYSIYVETNIEKPYQIIFKIIIFGIIINSSYFLISQLLDFINLFSTSISQIGENTTGYTLNFSNLISNINKHINYNSDNLEYNMFSYDGILKSFINVGLLNIMLLYSLRYILILLFSFLSPFAFLCLISPTTSWIFKSWLRCYFSLLIIQVFIPIIILIIFSIDSSNSILYIAGIYALSKFNDYIKEIFGGVSLNISYQLNNLKTLNSK